MREGANHVVRLIVRHLQHGDAHCFQNCLDMRNGRNDILRRGIPIGFVEGVQLPPKRPSRWVECLTEVFGLFTGYEVVQELGKAENGRGIQPLRIAHRTVDEGIVEPEYQRVGVNQKKFFHRREKGA